MSFTGSLMTDKDCTGLQFDAEEIKLRKHIKYSNRDEFFFFFLDWILLLHVKHNIIRMSSTGPLAVLNLFELIFYFFSAHFWQYLDNRNTNVGFQLVQSSSIVRVNTVIYIALQKEIVGSCGSLILEIIILGNFLAKEFD